MFWDAPPWPRVEFGNCKPLMLVAEVEEFAPLVEPELADDVSLDEAAQIPGGAAAYARIRRRAEREQVS